MRKGVYECQRGTDQIRVIVAGELPRTENNALLHLLSAAPEQVKYGVAHYQQHSGETSTLLGRLFEDYRREGLIVSYTMEDFRRDYVKEHLQDLTPEERLEGLTSEERLKGLPPEELLQMREEIERHLSGVQPPPRSRKRRKKQ